MTPRCQSGEGELGEVMGGKGKGDFRMRRGEAKYPRKEVGLRRTSHEQEGNTGKGER